MRALTKHEQLMRRLCAVERQYILKVAKSDGEKLLASLLSDAVTHLIRAKQFAKAEELIPIRTNCDSLGIHSTREC